MDLYQYLQSAQKSLFRFEALQEYKVEGDEIDDKDLIEWWDFITSKTKSGVVMERVRLIVEPLTEYTKRELVIHAKSKTLGDDIKTIDEVVFNKLHIQQEDFWLIDEKLALIMQYSETGNYLSFDVIERDVEKYIATKDMLIAHSSPL